MMTQKDDLNNNQLPWLRSNFDLEGWVGALAAWLIGLLLGIIFQPLFWLGAIAAIIILMATRKAVRTPPQGANLIVAPCDGILHSISETAPPSELCLAGDDWTRLRISVPPSATNTLHAAMDGAIATIILNTGDPSTFSAIKPDTDGLSECFVTLDSNDRTIGTRLATGGLGPRLELTSEVHDAVRLGRHIGKLRFGGWCDLYIPKTIGLKVWPGQTLTGSETIIGQFEAAEHDMTQSDIVAPQTMSVSPDESSGSQSGADPARSDVPQPPAETPAPAPSSTPDASEDNKDAAEKKTKQKKKKKTETEDIADILARIREDVSSKGSLDED
ncbi:MAG: phosphatidylserine decarboxylase [Henriciella sp.]